MLRVLSRPYSTLSALVLTLGGVRRSGSVRPRPRRTPRWPETRSRPPKDSKDFDPVMRSAAARGLARCPRVACSAWWSSFRGHRGREERPISTLSVRRLEPRNPVRSSPASGRLVELPHDGQRSAISASSTRRGLPLRAIDDRRRALAEQGLPRAQVIGTLARRTRTSSDGNLVVRSTYYRHWPRYFFVTRSAHAATMRQ